MRASSANRLRHSWRADEGVVLGVQESGVVRKADRHAFHRGDFVCVLATVDLSSRIVYNTKHVRATFKPVQVIRLAPFTIVKELFPLAETTTSDDVDMVQEGHIQRTRAQITLDPSLQ